MSNPLPITRLASIAQKYDAFLLDVWGTIHNGEVVYPDVMPCLQELQEANKQVCLLSNSPSRIASLIKKLDSHFGITAAHYNFAHNSGEASHKALKDRKDDFHAALGANYYLIGLDIHKTNLADLPFYRETDFAGADFIYVSRTFDDDADMAQQAALLPEALKRNMPMLCSNPDRTVGVGDILYKCAGALAELYEKMGGTVFYHGKPYHSVYDTVTDMLGQPDQSRILAVGDGLGTDIKGASDYGIDTLLLTDGIHKDDFGNNRAEMLYHRHATLPTYVMPQLKW